MYGREKVTICAVFVTFVVFDRPFFVNFPDDRFRYRVDLSPLTGRGFLDDAEIQQLVDLRADGFSAV